MRCGSAFGRICLCVCLSVCKNALTFESTQSLIKKVYFWYAGTYLFRIFRLNSYIKIIGSRSRSPEQKREISSRHAFCDKHGAVSLQMQ